MVVTNTLMEAVELTADARCYLFDMDGLIFDTERLFMRELKAVMAEQGYELTEDVYVQTLGLGGDKLRDFMLSVYGEQYPFREMGHQALARQNQWIEREGLEVKPEIRSVLQWIRGRGRRASVASSTKTEQVLCYLRQAELIDYFDCVIGGECVEHSKPSPDIFLLAAEKSGVKPEECVVLEDSENGIRAAYSAGMRSICVPDLKMPSEEVREQITVLVQRNE